MRRITETKLDSDNNPILDADGNEIKETKIIGTKEVSMIDFIRSRKMEIGSLETKTVIENEKEVKKLYFSSWSVEVLREDWHDAEDETNPENYISVYPRMVIESLAVKTSSD